MKIVQSFWSGNRSDFTGSYGWCRYKYNWLSWILSCHQLVKYHKEVELYTDQFGYDILIGKLQLPYTKVHVVLDELNHYDKNLWAVAKIRTFQLQTVPFLHVDGDVFVWESLSDKFKESNLVVQNIEATTDFYSFNWKNILPQLLFEPREMKGYSENLNSFACNMGIIGGHNLDFIQLFSEKSMEFVNRNATCFKSLDNLNFNVFFEQVLFYEMTKAHDQDIRFYSPKVHMTIEYKGFGDFDKVPDKKYLHLMGRFKTNELVCRAMETYVMKYYPEAYSRLGALINQAEKDNAEMEALDAAGVARLIADFAAGLWESRPDVDQYLLKRDLYNEGLPCRFDTHLSNGEDFYICLVKGFERTTVTEGENEIECLLIQEMNFRPICYQLHELDEVILNAMQQPVLYSVFINKMKDCLEEEDRESMTEFLSIVNKTLRNYLIQKIISIYN